MGGGNERRPDVPSLDTAYQTNPYEVMDPDMERALKARAEFAREEIARRSGMASEGALAAMQRAGVAGSGSTGAAMRGIAGEQTAALGGVEADLLSRDLEGRMSLMDALNLAKDRQNQAKLDIYGIRTGVYSEDKADRQRKARGVGKAAGTAVGAWAGGAQGAQGGGQAGESAGGYFGG